MWHYLLQTCEPNTKKVTPPRQLSCTYQVHVEQGISPQYKCHTRQTVHPTYSGVVLGLCPKTHNGVPELRGLEGGNRVPGSACSTGTLQ
mmetsp:Transcript_32398/g.58083  ORF Transcript_32398/g.58083 Transcript_32398/m.58083 type:complete len:89 (+) Transcript_32398:1129-1395(+)